MAEPRTEGAVVDRTSDLQQQVGPASRPSHLLGLVHTTINQEVRCAFRNRSPDAQAGTISFGVIDEPAALVAEIIADLVQRAPQLAGWDARRGFKSHEAADRFCREHGELRHLLRLRRRHNQTVSVFLRRSRFTKGVEIALTIMQSA
jgi:hypothetical protein